MFRNFNEWNLRLGILDVLCKHIHTPHFAGCSSGFIFFPTENTTFLSMGSLLWKVTFICANCSKYYISLLVLQQSTADCVEQSPEFFKTILRVKGEDQVVGVLKDLSPGLVEECCLPPTFSNGLLFEPVIFFNTEMSPILHNIIKELIFKSHHMVYSLNVK